MNADSTSPTTTNTHGTSSDWRDTLLFTRRDVTMVMDPFPYFYIDNFLPADLFKEARTKFPVNEEVEQYANHKKVFSLHRHPQNVTSFVNRTPVWNDLISFFDSDRFIHDVNQFLRPALRKARGIEGIRKWRRRDRENIRPVVDVPVTFGYEFSILEDGAHLRPHTDAPAKLVSLLLYFAPDDWCEKFGGTTNMYRSKDPQLSPNWMNQNQEFEDVDTVFSSAFVPNRLCGFVKSPNSLHGVSPVRCGPHRNRLTFNFNVLLDPIEANSFRVRARNE